MSQPKTDAAVASAPGAWRLCVAPMMDWTDRHCRYFHRLLSPHARLYSEMVVAQAVLHGDRKRLLGFSKQEHPLALQLGGSDPGLLAQAARIGEDFGYDEINLNCGCPSDRVQSGRFGACLMLEPALVADCVAAMRSAVAIPVTVKCRIGVDDQDEQTTLGHFVEQVAAAGCEVFFVHARKAMLKGLNPKENREIPPLRYALAYELKQRHPQLTVVLNGGLASQADCARPLTELDGVMLGRAAYHDPYLLAALEQQCFGTTPISREMGVELMHRYVLEVAHHGVLARHVGRHMLGLYQGVTGAKAWRQALATGALPLAAAALLRPNDESRAPLEACTAEC